MGYEVRPVLIKNIVVKVDVQPRESMSPDKIKEYGQNYANDVWMPPITLHEVDGVLYLCDGFTRLAGANEAGLRTIKCSIRLNSTWPALIVDAIKMNRQHGQPLTSTERRKSIIKLVDMFSKSDQPWTQEAVAKACGVAQSTVSRMVADRFPGVKERLDTSPNPVRDAVAAIRENKIQAEIAKQDAYNLKDPRIRAQRTVIQDRIDNARIHTEAIFQAARIVSEHLTKLTNLPGGENVMGNMPLLTRAKNDLLLIKQMQPHCICDDCDSFGCDRCTQRGWLTVSAAKFMKGK